MNIKVKVIANSKENKIENLGDFYKVHLKEKAEKGKANKSLIELLAEHFKKKKGQIRILSGMTSNIKIIELAD